MQPTDDITLLRQYAENHSDEAFAGLVTRHVNLVYSVALRQVGNPHHAEEITQAVFIILAKKAASLRHERAVSSWLFQTTRLTANNFVRSETRRHRREEEARMQSVLNESENELWPKIAPFLDAAVADLREKDRQAIMLRYYEGRNLREVGLALGASEDAAEKRVNRALEKLRKFFSRKGVNSTTAIIAGAMAANSVQAAPAVLAKSVTVVAVAKGMTASGSTLMLVKGVLKILGWMKLKFVCGIGAAVLLTGSVTVVVLTTMAVSVNPADGTDRYQIDGDLVYATTDSEFVRNFTLTVNGRNWAIHLTNPKPEVRPIDRAAFSMPPQAAGPPPKYEEVVSLNGSVYRYVYFGQPFWSSSARNSGNAVIEYGESAIEDGTFANFVWVGLASGHYFSQLTNDEVTSMSAVPDARNEKAKAQWQLNDVAPQLPKSIDYFQRPIQGIVVGPGVINHQFDNGWKSGEVRVLQETNINGKTFPMVYTYEQFRPKVNGATSSNDLEHQLLVTVTVHTIRLHSVPDILTPQTKGETVVIDRRLPNEDGAALLNASRLPKDIGKKGGIPPRLPPGSFGQQAFYLSTANRLPEKPDVEAIQKFKQQLASHSTTTSHRRISVEQSSNLKWIWLPTALVISAATVIAGLMKRKRGN